MARKTTNIRRRGNAFQLYYRDGTGRQRSETFSFRKFGGERGAKAAAETRLANVKLQIVRGEYRAPARIRFDVFAAEWLDDYARVHVRPKTFEGYEGVLRVHLLPQFGRMFLGDITRKSIDAFVADWSTCGPAYQERLRAAREAELVRAAREDRPPRPVRLGHSPKTIANALVPLREMLGHAVEWGYLTANPAIGVRRPRVESGHDEMRALDADQVGRLLEHAPAEGRALLLCAVTTGLRRGELLGLRWGDVDWDAGRLWVRRSVGHDGEFQQPKTRGSVRAVAMPATLVWTLREHRMASCFKELDDLVFPSERGTPLDGGNMVKRFLLPALRAARLPHVRFHDLRHTYASLLIAQGAHPKLISEQLGHASVQITLDRYGHLMDQSYGDASAQLEAALFGGNPGSVLAASADVDVPSRAPSRPVSVVASA